MPMTPIELLDFTGYVNSFYGFKSKIAPFNCSASIINTACLLVYSTKKDDFAGDSMDRETVRSILEALGFREIPQRYKYVCEHCDTETIVWEGTVYFDSSTQSLQALQDDGEPDSSSCTECFCNACDKKVVA